MQVFLCWRLHRDKKLIIDNKLPLVGVSPSDRSSSEPSEEADARRAHTL